MGNLVSNPWLDAATQLRAFYEDMPLRTFARHLCDGTLPVPDGYWTETQLSDIAAIFKRCRSVQGMSLNRVYMALRRYDLVRKNQAKRAELVKREWDQSSI